MIAKTRPVRSESYRRWVASHPCFGCGLEGYSQCAHANGGGMGTKTSDLETFPLCAAGPAGIGCHVKFDQCIGMNKTSRRELTLELVERMQDLARQAGRKEFQ